MQLIRVSDISAKGAAVEIYPESGYRELIDGLMSEF